MPNEVNYSKILQWETWCPHRTGHAHSSVLQMRVSERLRWTKWMLSVVITCNFKFEKNGVRVWKAYVTGPGNLIHFSDLICKKQVSPGLNVHDGFFPFRNVWVYKTTSHDDDVEHEGLFYCSEPGCQIVWLSQLAIKHPVFYDTYSLCDCLRDGHLQTFNVAMLKEILRHFEISFTSKDRKKELLAKLSSFVEGCECFR